MNKRKISKLLAHTKKVKKEKAKIRKLESTGKQG